MHYISIILVTIPMSQLLALPQALPAFSKENLSANQESLKQASKSNDFLTNILSPLTKAINENNGESNSQPGANIIDQKTNFAEDSISESTGVEQVSQNALAQVDKQSKDSSKDVEDAPKVLDKAMETSKPSESRAGLNDPVSVPLSQDDLIQPQSQVQGKGKGDGNDINIVNRVIVNDGQGSFPPKPRPYPPHHHRHRHHYRPENSYDDEYPHYHPENEYDEEYSNHHYSPENDYESNSYE